MLYGPLICNVELSESVQTCKALQDLFEWLKYIQDRFLLSSAKDRESNVNWFL